ncbi:MAG: hypothetical protein IOD12_10880 [Silvanigrellales bacterium]|nr:hypothetical protein [Silvanigrellales bacterium]
MNTLTVPFLLAPSLSLALALTTACGSGGDSANDALESRVAGLSFAGPALGLDAAEVCRRLGSIYNVAQGPSWTRKKAPILPSNFWLTSNERLKEGTNFVRDSFSCDENTVTMEHRGNLVYGTGGFFGLGERIETRTIRQKDVFTIDSNGAVTDDIFFEGRDGTLEKSEFSIFITRLEWGVTEYGGTIPFPLPVCPLGIGVKDFSKCEIRLYHKADVVDGQVTGYDGWTVVAIDKAGRIAKQQVTPASITLASDRAKVAR